jgi:hypothetical protein
MIARTVLFSACLASTAWAADPPAMVVYVQGTVKIVKASGSELPASLGSEIDEADTLVTDDASQVRVRLFDRSLLRIGPSSRAQMSQLRIDSQGEHKEVSVKLFVGRLWASVSKLLTPDSRFEVHAANAVAGVRGTKIDVQSDGKNGSVACLEGKVEVKNGSNTATIVGGNELAFQGVGLGQIVKLTEQQIMQRNFEARGLHAAGGAFGERGAEAKADKLAAAIQAHLNAGGTRQSFFDVDHRRDHDDRDHELAADLRNRGAAFQEYNEAERLKIPLDRTRIDGTVQVRP